ncbi:MAG: hypothetical protein J6R38_03300 [Alistipes sp.]|nr:hypothetical protein [Alistipes sp.]
MKKLLFMVVAALVAVTPLYAQSNKELRQISKDAKVAAKEAEKEGYKMLEPGNLESEIAKHITRRASGEVFEIVNIVTGKKSVNMAKSQARNNVLNEHAESARSLVQGRVTSDMQDISGEQAENFLAAYERLVCAELSGEVRVSYTLVRHNKKENTYDVKLVCYVDYEAAHKAHLNALNRAAEQQQLAQKYGSNISNWIQEGFVNRIVE